MLWQAEQAGFARCCSILSRNVPLNRAFPAQERWGCRWRRCIEQIFQNPLAALTGLVRVGHRFVKHLRV